MIKEFVKSLLLEIGMSFKMGVIDCNFGDWFLKHKQACSAAVAARIFKCFQLLLCCLSDWITFLKETCIYQVAIQCKSETLLQYKYNSWDLCVQTARRKWLTLTYTLNITLFLVNWKKDTTAFCFYYERIWSQKKIPN